MSAILDSDDDSMEQCLYCGHALQDHGEGICFATLGCRCKGYLTPHEEGAHAV